MNPYGHERALLACAMMDPSVLARDKAFEYARVKAENDALKAENAGLSANQRLHDIHGDESGNLYCPRIAELEATVATLLTTVTTLSGQVRPIIAERVAASFAVK